MISEVRKIYMQDIIIGICVTYPTRIRGVTFHSLLVTRWNLLVACYSWQKLLVAKNHSLLVAKFARYSLQKFFVAKNHSLLVAKFPPYSLQKLLLAKNHFTRCKICLLFVAKVARYSLQKLLVAKNHSLLIALLISIATYYAK